MIFFLVNQPRTGGDSASSSQVITPQRLSPPLVALPRAFNPVHSGVEQIRKLAGSDYRSLEHTGESFPLQEGGDVTHHEPVDNVHPLVRRHPVTGDDR